jgi:hypothetical protein
MGKKVPAREPLLESSKSPAVGALRPPPPPLRLVRPRAALLFPAPALGPCAQNSLCPTPSSVLRQNPSLEPWSPGGTEGRGGGGAGLAARRPCMCLQTTKHSFSSPGKKCPLRARVVTSNAHAPVPRRPAGAPNRGGLAVGCPGGPRGCLWGLGRGRAHQAAAAVGRACSEGGRKSGNEAAAGLLELRKHAFSNTYLCPS